MNHHFDQQSTPDLKRDCMRVNSVGVTDPGTPTHERGCGQLSIDL